MFKRTLSLAFALSLLGTPVLAQSTAAQVAPGYNSTIGPNCSTGPCFNPLGTTVPGIAAASSLVLTASPGNLLGAYVTSGSTQGWLMVFNKTTAPTNGAATAGTATGDYEECIYVPANSTQSISFQGLPVERYSVGITMVYSSTSCASITLSNTAVLHGLAQ